MVSLIHLVSSMLLAPQVSKDVQFDPQMTFVEVLFAANSSAVLDYSFCDVSSWLLV